MQKMTIANKFDEVVKMINGEESVLSVEEAIDFLNDRKAKSIKKSADKKSTARQKENEGVKATILEVMSAEGKTVTEIMGLSSAFEGMSNQRISALLRQLVLEGKVVKTVEGKKSLFALA